MVAHNSVGFVGEVEDSENLLAAKPSENLAVSACYVAAVAVVVAAAVASARTVVSVAVLFAAAVAAVVTVVASVAPFVGCAGLKRFARLGGFQRSRVAVE